MKREKRLFDFFLILATAGALAAHTVVSGESWTAVRKPYAMAIMILLVLGSVQILEQLQVSFQRKQMVLAALCYLISVMIISLVPEKQMGSWWMIGAAAAALYLHLYLGFALQGVLTYLLCGLYGYSIESFIFYLVIGLLLCVLVRYMTDWKSFGYVLMIALSSELTLIFVMNNFAWKLATGKDTLYALISTGAVVIAAYLLPYKKLPEETTGKETAGKEATVKETAAAETEAKYEETEAVILEVLAESFPLRQRLQAYSESLYRHSLHISSVAQEAAFCVGCNDKIVQAGGLYHEVGKIKGKDYIKEGVALGKEYQLPEPVIDIIRQHNFNYEKPQTIEAAVVMLTDSIVSTIEYVEKEQKGKKMQISREKIIEQIFELRLSKGTLDESGMDIRNYKKLKEFFKKEYTKGENR